MDQNTLIAIGGLLAAWWLSTLKVPKKPHSIPLTPINNPITTPMTPINHPKTQPLTPIKSPLTNPQTTPLSPLTPPSTTPLMPLVPPYTPPKTRGWNLLPPFGWCLSVSSSYGGKPDVKNNCPNWPFTWQAVNPSMLQCTSVLGPGFAPTYDGRGCAYNGEGMVRFIVTNA